MEILSVKNIIKLYDSTKALDDISFAVEKGSVFGLLGPNGAGKTTLLRVINQITVQDSGKVILNGEDLTFRDNHLIGYLPEERGLYPTMKVKDQILYFGQLKGLSKSEANTLLTYWLARFEIKQYKERKISELSKGNQQKVQIICALIHKPKLLLMDEPFSGFDPINAQILTNVIAELSAEGTTIILSSHNMASVEQLCQSIVLINKGRDILSGKVADIKDKYRDNCYNVTTSSHINTDSYFQEFSVLSNVEDNDKIKYIIKKNGDVSNNKMLIRLSEESEILHFSDVVPSLNDIFIQCVNNKENE